MTRRGSGFGYVVAAAVAVWAMPAAAADGGTCIVERISEQQMADFFAAYRAGQPPSDTLRDTLRAASQACAETHSWTPGQEEAARRHTVARIFHDRLTRESPFSADQLTRLDTAFDTVDPDTIQRWIDQGIPEAEHARLNDMLAATGVEVDERTGVFVGEYMAARHLLAVTGAAFAAS